MYERRTVDDEAVDLGVMDGEVDDVRDIGVWLEFSDRDSFLVWLWLLCVF